MSNEVMVQVKRILITELEKINEKRNLPLQIGLLFLRNHRHE